MKQIALVVVLIAMLVGCQKEGVVPQRVVPPGQIMQQQPVPPLLPEPIKKPQVIVMDFWAPWCAPCRHFAPTFEAWSKKYSNENVKFVKVNADDHKDLLKKYGVSALPTVIVEIDGKVVAKFEGAPKEEQIVVHLPK